MQRTMRRGSQRPDRKRVRRFEPLEPRRLLEGSLVISEFMASNQNTLADDDGAYSDWIEIHNPTRAAEDLAGWHLTDRTDDLNEWTFPTVTLDPGGYLVVFASGKDRIDPARTLHTNFKLDGNGEYLALVRPDGTIASDFSPEFFRQKDDVSYGLGQQITPLVTAGATAAVLVPANGNLGTSWTAEGFNDSAWTHGATGVGFETAGAAQFEAIAYGNQAGNVGSQEWGGPLGLDFYVHRPITVTQLGVFDSGSDGLARTLTAELWTRSGNTGTRRAQLTFTPTDPGALVGGDRFKSLATPLVLQPGDYTIVAYGYGAGEPNGNTGGPPSSQKTTNDGNGAIEFVGSARYGATAGAFPASVDGGPVNRYSAGTLKFLVPAYTGLIGTNLQTAMHGVNASAYTRIEFSSAAPDGLSSLTLRMKYNDGFVAYLNGTEVARRNAPAAVAWNSAAPASRGAEASVTFENINITDQLGQLHAGTNVLAIQGLNAGAGSGDFLLVPELTAAGAPGAPPRYFDTPSPGSPNDSASSFAGFVDDVQLSVGHGFFQSPFDVAITTTTAGAQIYYTLDGTEPTPTHGTRYQAPVHVTATATLRAAGFRTDFLPTRINTETYLFLDSVLSQSNTPAGYPAAWAGYTADYGMSQNAADLPAIAGNSGYTVAQARQVIKNSLLALPTMSIVLPPGSLFDAATGIYVNPTGRDSDNWEKAASIEYLLPDGSPGFQIDGGVQIMGYTSRSLANSPKLSMRLVFKREYGEATLNYPFFRDSPVQQYNTVCLRSNGRDSWLSGDEGTGYRSHALMIRNQWADLAQKEMGEPATSGSFVHLYINGMYWGIYNPTERPDADFAESYLGGDAGDYDVVKFCYPRAIDGDMTKWNELLSLAGAGLGSDAAYQYIQGNNPDGTRNPNYEVLLDVDNLIDYVINGQYHASIDWPGNYYVARKRGPDSTGFKFFTWDNDLAMPYEDVARSKTQLDWDVWWNQSPGKLDLALRANAEYRSRFADRVQKQFFNGGSLTPQAAADRFTRIANQIQPALAAESARWGDYRRDVSPVGTERMLHTPGQWQAVSNTMLTSYFPGRTNVVLGQLRAVGLYPGIAAPSLSQFGGSIPAGFSLTMSAPAGAVYYTLDGSDPRLAGGAIHGTRCTGPVSLGESVVVKARAWNGTTWSALTEAEFQVAGMPQAGLVLTEINYHPTPPTTDERAQGLTDADSFEFIELANLGTTQTLDLHGVKFTAGITFDFTNQSSITSLMPGQRVLIVQNPAAFAARHGPGLPIAGAFGGNLNNGGERIALVDGNNVTLADFTYGDSGEWPGRADGQGSSLELANLAGEYGDPNHWQASAEFDGSPGQAGVGPAADVIVNEVLAHSDQPLVDAIELYNTTGSPINLGGWYLSDSSADYLRFRIPDSTVIAAHGYLVLNEGHWVNGALAFADNEFGGGLKGFGLDSVRGDDVYLVQAEGDKPVRFADHVDFGATASGKALARWRDDEGRWHLVPAVRSTLEAPDNANSSNGTGPSAGPLVISEVMYAPRALTANERTAGFLTPEDMEFIEVFNPAAAAVALTNWHLDKAVSYAFAAGSSLAAGAALVVVPFDPANPAMLAAFRTRYGIGSLVTVVGPYSGRLDNLGDRVQLECPDAPPPGEPSYYPRVLADEVVYRSSWGAGGADGKSLQRVAAAVWGDNRASWGVAAASPGTARLVAGAYLFYNNSAFDGRAAAANSDDDRAIATDKQPLLPGRRATFDNYTSFNRGINGIMVDLPGTTGTVVAGDFGFRVSSGDNPPVWSTLATVPAVTSRAVAGMTRVTMVWPDDSQAPKNQWLEVTVRSGIGMHTGLAAPHVFHFGSAVGETGNHSFGLSADASVDSSDELDTQLNATSATPAPITSRWDLNRDRRINATDVLIARANLRQGMDSLRLLDLTEGGQAAASAATVAAIAAGTEYSVSSTQSPVRRTKYEARRTPRFADRSASSEAGGSFANDAALRTVRRGSPAQADATVPPQVAAPARTPPSAQAAAHDSLLATADRLDGFSWLWQAQRQPLRRRTAAAPGHAALETLPLDGQTPRIGLR